MSVSFACDLLFSADWQAELCFELLGLAYLMVTSQGSQPNRLANNSTDQTILPGQTIVTQDVYTQLGDRRT